MVWWGKAFISRYAAFCAHSSTASCTTWWWQYLKAVCPVIHHPCWSHLPDLSSSVSSLQRYRRHLSPCHLEYLQLCSDNGISSKQWSKTVSQKNQANKTELRFHGSRRIYQLRISWIFCCCCLVGFGGWGGLGRRRGLRLITPHILEGYLAV